MNEERFLEELGLGEIPDEGVTLDPGQALFQEPDPDSTEPLDQFSRSKHTPPAPQNFKNAQADIKSIAIPADVISTFDTRPVNTRDFLLSGAGNCLARKCS